VIRPVQQSKDDYHATVAGVLKWESCATSRDSDAEYAWYNGFRIHRGPKSAPFILAGPNLSPEALWRNLGAKHELEPYLDLASVADIARVIDDFVEQDER
jgi:hypothetical protein